MPSSPHHFLPATSAKDHRCQVVFNQDRGAGLRLLRLQVITAPEGPPANFSCQPGQFIMLDLPKSGFYFRRPFSVLTTHRPDQFDLYYKVVGTGTRLMAEFQPGDMIKCLGPLGTGFTPPTAPDKALYIGGGIGIAPLYFMAKALKIDSISGHCFYGVRGKTEIGLEAELSAVFNERLQIATDDGSRGFSGNVCQLLSAREEQVQAAHEAYICGPTRMMAAASDLLYRINPAIKIEVSLEERMPCGTGACTGCVVLRTDQILPSKVCLEGPVFDARLIEWGSEHAFDNKICESQPCPN